MHFAYFRSLHTHLSSAPEPRWGTSVPRLPVCPPIANSWLHPCKQTQDEMSKEQFKMVFRSCCTTTQWNEHPLQRSGNTQTDYVFQPSRKNSSKQRVQRHKYSTLRAHSTTMAIGVNAATNWHGVLSTKSQDGTKTSSSKQLQMRRLLPQSSPAYPAASILHLLETNSQSKHQ